MSEPTAPLTPTEIESLLLITQIPAAVGNTIFRQSERYREQNSALRYVVAQLLSSLPANRDWLDPEIERLAKTVLKESLCPK